MLWDRQFPSTQAGEGVTDFEVHRLKGLLRLTDGRIRIIQGVREVFEITDPEPNQYSSAVSSSKIVLIGKGLGGDGSVWQRSLMDAMAKTS